MNRRIIDLLDLGTKELKEKNINTTFLDLCLILSFIINRSKEEIICSIYEELDNEKCLDFFDALKQRKQGVSVAHIIGKKEFYGMDFKMDKGVFVPRNDTELLLETGINIIDYIKHNYNRNIKVYECCIGSGCIAITLKKLRADIDIQGGDISLKAINLARQNSLNILNHELEFHHSNLLNSILKDKRNRLSYDLIISNPPYITSKKSIVLSEKFLEPLQAFDGGRDGLDLIENIIYQSRMILKYKGFVLIEADPKQEKKIEKIFKKHNFIDFFYKKDLANKKRVFGARLKIGG